MRVVPGEERIFTHDVLVRALERGLIEPRVSARALGRAAGVAGWTAARWIKGDRMAPVTEAKLRAVLGLDEDVVT